MSPKPIYFLINRQIYRQVKTLKEVSKEEESPMVTISRQSGSGGRIIAEELLKKLGKRWTFWHKEIIEEIAERARVRKELVKMVDEKTPGFIEGLFKELTGKGSFSESAYYRHLLEVISAIGQRGYAIILGRGANFILPRAFNVRILASFDVRVERMVTYEKYTREQATRYLHEWDKERIEFVKNFFGKNIDNPNYYDLVVRTDNFSLTSATEILYTAIKKRFSLH